MTFKGLAAVSGIVFFYFMERFLNILTEWWQKRQKKDKVVEFDCLLTQSMLIIPHLLVG
jgi:hypothetical protein